MNTRSYLAVELEKMPHALRASEPAKILSTSKMTIYRLVGQGAIPYFRVGGLIRFDPQAIADWLRRKMPLNQTAASACASSGSDAGPGRGNVAFTFCSASLSLAGLR